LPECTGEIALMKFNIHKSHSSSGIVAGLIGNVMEWYDFALFGYFVPYISASLFPDSNTTSALLATWAVFACGFLMRPLGGAIFGYIGDRIGRRRVLVLSVMLMTLPTFFLGALPTYAQIGVAASLLLIALRLIQGLSVGGEFSGSVTYMVETAPQNQRGLAGSWANVGSTAGLLLGSGAATAVTTFSSQHFAETWGWRIPFLMGLLLGILAWTQVRRLHEGHISHRDEKHKFRSPLKEAFTKDKKKTFQALAFTAGYGGTFYIPLVYLPDYIQRNTSMSLHTAMQINTIATAIILVLIPVSGWVSDRFIRRTHFLAIGFFLLAVLAYPMFELILSGEYAQVLTAQLIFAVLIVFPLGSAPALLVELFPTDDRLTGYSVAFNIGIGVVGGTTPMIATWLIDKTSVISAPAFYLSILAVVTVISLLMMNDRSRETLL
jgi:MHS family proline/betaine transporter-like MFS transporter